MPEPIKEKISLEEKKIRAGIAFPLDYEDASALKQSFFWVGQVALVNGIATIYNANILSTSVGVASHAVFNGIIGVLSVLCYNGYATITSSSTNDNSLVNVLIVF